MSFTAGGSGVYPVPVEVPTLSDQLDNFECLVASGCITQPQIDASVVLVTVYSNDYDRVGWPSLAPLSTVTAIIKYI
jgi:hypothetical protein